MTRRAKKRVALLMGAVIVMGVVIAGAYGLRQVQRESITGKLHERGMQAFAEKDYPATLENLGAYLGRNPTDVEALLAVAEAHQNVPQDNAKHLQEAIRFAYAAANEAPDDVRPLELLLDLYAFVGFLSEAESTAQKLLAVEPAHYKAMGIVIEAHAQRGRLDEALAAARSMAGEYPDDIVVQNTIVSLMQEMELPQDEILAYTDELVAVHPERVELALLQMRLLIAGGARENEDRVLEAAKAASLMEFTDATSLNQMLTILDGLRRERLANETIDRVLADPDKVEWAAVAVAERAWRNDRPEKATEYIALVEDVSAAEADVRLLAWRLFLSPEIEGIKTPNESMQALMAAESREARSWVELLRGRVAMESGEWIEARDHLHASIETLPGNVLARFMLGEVSDRLGEWCAAESAWTDVIRQQPGWLRPRLALATLLLREGKLEEADQIAVETGRLNPTNWRAAWMVAQTSVRLLEEHALAQERVGLLEDYLRSIAEQTPEWGEPLALLARMYIATDRPERAEQVVETLLERRPSIETDAALRLAEACRDVGIEHVDALVVFAGGEEHGDPRVLFAQATQFADNGQPEAGERLLRDAFAAAPNNKTLQRVLAVYLDRTQRPDAAEALTRYASENPDEASAQLALLEGRSPWLLDSENAVADAIGRLRHLTGDDATGWRLYEVKRYLRYDRTSAKAGQYVELMAQTLRREPDNWEALVSMADLMIVTDPRDPAPAIRYLAQAVDSNPDRPDLLMELVRMLLRSGDTGKAKRRLAELNRFNDLTETQKLTRAELLWEGGQWDQAIDELVALGDNAGDEGLIRLTRMFAARGRMSDADTTIERLLGMGTTDVSVIAAAADYLAQQGRIDDARRLFDDAAKDDSALITVTRARFLATHGDLDEAKRVLEEYVKEVGTTDAWLELALLHATTGNQDALTSTLADARGQLPDDPRILAANDIVKLSAGATVEITTPEPFIRSMLIANETEPAVELVGLLTRDADGTADEPLEPEIERLTTRYPSFYIAWHVLAAVQAQSGDLPRAIETARRAAQIFPSDARPLRVAVALLSNQKRYDDAFVVAQQWRERVLSDPLEAELVLAELANATRRHDDAVRWLLPRQDRLVQEADRYPERLELLVTSLALAGRADEARALIGNRPETDPRWARIALTAARSSTGTFEEIASWIAEIEPLMSSTSEERLRVGQAWLDLATASKNDAHHERVYVVSEPALRDPATRGRAQLLRAMSYHQRDRKAEALAAYEAASEDIREQPFILNNIAYLTLEVDGDASKAVRVATQAVEVADARGGAPHEYLDTLGYALLADAQPAEAETVFRRAHLLAPTDVRTLAGITISLVEQDQADDSVTFIRDIAGARVREHSVLSAAQHYEERDQPARAQVLYELALAEFPDSAAALNNYAFMLVSNQMLPERAVEMATRAVAVAESQGAPPQVLVTLFDTLGLANASAGNHVGAEAAFRRGLQLAPEDVKLLVGLAESLVAQGRDAEAQEIIDKLPHKQGARSDGQPAGLRDRILSLVDESP